MSDMMCFRLFMAAYRTNEFFYFSLDPMWRTTEYLQSSLNTGRMNFMKIWRLLMYVYSTSLDRVYRSHLWFSVNQYPWLTLNWHFMDIYISISFNLWSNSQLTCQSEVSWQHTCHRVEQYMWVSRHSANYFINKQMIELLTEYHSRFQPSF